MQDSYSQGLRHQRQAVQTALKEIELFCFNVEVTGDLQTLEQDLRLLQLKYGMSVQRYQGLVLSPKTTSSAD